MEEITDLARRAAIGQFVPAGSIELLGTDVEGLHAAVLLRTPTNPDESRLHLVLFRNAGSPGDFLGALTSQASGERQDPAAADITVLDHFHSPGKLVRGRPLLRAPVHAVVVRAPAGTVLHVGKTQREITVPGANPGTSGLAPVVWSGGSRLTLRAKLPGQEAVRPYVLAASRTGMADLAAGPRQGWRRPQSGARGPLRSAGSLGQR